MEVSDYLHILVALHPRKTPVPIGYEVVWVPELFLFVVNRKFLLCRESNPSLPATSH
jgi:hypothetical protein